MSTTAQQMRHWSGPAIFSFGFRPFFFGASIWAAVAMALWMAMLLGALALPTAFDPVSWHAHEFLFGYLGAVIAGFMLTAVPNWTGRLPVVGWPLAGLFSLWLLGRAAMTFSGAVPPTLVAAFDLLFPVALTVTMAREIIAGRNWRNLMVVGLVAVFTFANGVFHWEAAQGLYAADGYGLRLGLGAVIMMVSLIGGRIVPSFTRNWLAKRQTAVLPVPPMQTYDKACLLALLTAIIAWLFWPQAAVSGVLLLVAGALHLVRLARWAGYQTLAEPLVWVLHFGYVFVPLGAIALGLAMLFPNVGGTAAAQHLWMAGAIGLMTLAVMTRATLGHSGQTLTAGLGTTALYGLVIIAVLSRVLAGIWPQGISALHMLSGASWIAAFCGFALLYGRLLVRASP